MQTYLYGYGSGPYGASTTRRTRAYIESQASFAMVDPELRRRLFALADAVIAAGGDYGFGGGGRTSQEQLNLFLSRYTKVSAGTTGAFYWDGMPTYPQHAGWYKHTSGASAAPPGRSYHEQTTNSGNGFAYAVDMLGNHAMGNSLATQYGLKHFANVNGEPWHYQPIEIATARKNYAGPEPLPIFALPGDPDPSPLPIPPGDFDMQKIHVHNPIRLLDTRNTGKPGANTSHKVSPHGYTPKGAPVFLNITVTEAAGPGFVTVWDGVTALPEGSQVNYGPTDTSPKNGFAMTSTADADGTFKYYVKASATVIIDQVGFIEDIP